jgi:hypothetical protein
MAITDKDIRDVVESFVAIGNADGGLSEVMAHYTDQRSLAIRVMGTQFKTGFIFKDGRIQLLSGTDIPTVMVSMSKELFWDIINSENAAAARMKIYKSVYTTEEMEITPPPGIGGGALHFANVVKVFTVIAKEVMG